jgi:hypothetical protein
VSGLVTAGSATITGAATVGTTLGVTGVSTLASAVVTGALTVDTTTLVVDPTNDRVGIGTATPLSLLHVANGNILLSNAYFLSGRNAANTTTINLIGRNSSDEVVIDADGYGTKIGVGSAISIPSSGNVNITTGNVVMSTSGKGIDFSATANSSGTMTSELLNDYEEGTFTPVAVSLTVVGSVTYPVATYTKIGRVVYINLKVAASTSSTSTENVTYFTGLPFTPTVNSTVTAVNEQNIGSLGVGLFAANARLYSPTWTSIANATLSGFYYV